MSEQSQPVASPIRRVVVALDASPCSRMVLRTAARIAAGLGAQLEGLFVEDDRLLALADLPIAAELRQPGGVRPFDRALVERELRVVAQTVEKWAGPIVRAYDIVWRFRVVRGNIAQSLMEAAGEDTLLSLGRYGNPLCLRPDRLGSVAQRVLGEHRMPLLLLHQEMRVGQPVLVTTSGRAEELPLVAMAVRLSQVYASPLLVLTENDEARQFLAAALTDNPQPVTFHTLGSGDLAEQILILSQSRGGLVLSHRREPALARLECGLILL
ncbi:MAG: universal stress protein [Caldilineaceae bacterium]